MLLQWETWCPKRGEIYLVDLGEDSLDCEQRGVRPFLLLSNNIGNTMSSIVVGIPLSTRKKSLPIHVKLSRDCGLKHDSYAMAEHIRAVSKRRFFSKGNTPILVGVLTEDKILEVENAVKLELGFVS
jgi:mRNA-degrading endonuclease toxin of MazEF toxin-antitoxin module